MARKVPEKLPDLAADALRVAQTALAEDGPRDLTSETSVSADRLAVGSVDFRGRGVLAGIPYGTALANLAGCTVDWLAAEGERVTNQPIVRLGIGLLGILRAERPLLNLLQRACGIATATRSCVEALAGTGCRVLHTRKTGPGLRLFDAAAVVAGGGLVHRLDLSHTVLIKDNHWRAMREQGRSLADALALARERGALECQVEVESADQLKEACAAGADRLLLDNQTPEVVRRWGEQARGLRPTIAIEATGGITRASVRAYGEAGADFVSLGALTHSVTAADLALTLETT
jgi:nicotinate-nucleotide pyrophosphorylase (carboxylating)